jgi:hypothetical protein
MSSRQTIVEQDLELADKTRKMIKMFNPKTLMPNVIPTQELFDTAVEVANIDLVVYWRDKYNFEVKELSAVRANNPDILDYIDSWYEYHGREGFNPLLEDVAKVENMFYLIQFWEQMDNTFPYEFVRLNWYDGVAFLLAKSHADYGTYTSAIVIASDLQQWDMVRMILDIVARTNRNRFEQDINQHNLDLDYDSKELQDIFYDFNINYNPIQYQYIITTNLIINAINGGDWQTASNLFSTVTKQQKNKIAYELGDRKWNINYNDRNVQQFMYNIGIKI